MECLAHAFRSVCRVYLCIMWYTWSTTGENPWILLKLNNFWGWLQPIPHPHAPAWWRYWKIVNDNSWVVSTSLLWKRPLKKLFSGISCTFIYGIGNMLDLTLLCSLAFYSLNVCMNNSVWILNKQGKSPNGDVSWKIKCHDTAELAPDRNLVCRAVLKVLALLAIGHHL